MRLGEILPELIDRLEEDPLSDARADGIAHAYRLLLFALVARGRSGDPVRACFGASPHGSNTGGLLSAGPSFLPCGCSSSAGPSRAFSSCNARRVCARAVSGATPFVAAIPLAAI